MKVPKRAERLAIRRSGPSGAAGCRIDIRKHGQSVTILTNLLMLASGIISSVLVSRFLGASGRGDYVTWNILAATVSTLALLGLPQVLVLDTWTPGRHRLQELGLPLAITIGLSSMAIVSIGVVVGLSWAAGIGMMLVAIATQSGAVGAAEAQRMGSMISEFNLVRSLPLVSGLLALCVLALSTNRSAATWLVVVAAFQVVPLIIWLATTTNRQRKTRAPIRPTLDSTLRLAPGNWTTTLQYRVDILAIAIIYPARVVGIYAVGAAAQAAVLATAQATGMMWFSRRADTRENRSRQLGGQLRSTLFLALLAAVVLGGSAPWWVSAAYGSDFEQAVPLVVVLCVVGVIQSMDYLLAHECLLAGLGSRVLLFRLPSVVLVLVVYSATSKLSLEPALLATLPGAGFAVSALVFYKMSQQANRPPVEPSVASGPISE